MLLEKELTSAIESGDTRQLKQILEENHLKDINESIIREDDVDLNILHLTSGIDSSFRDQVIAWLLKEYKSCIDINKPSGIGNYYWTSCHIAASWGFHSTVDLLLRNGADPFTTDVNGHNVWDVSRAYDHFQCIYVLENIVRRAEDTILVIDDDDENDVGDGNGFLREEPGGEEEEEEKKDNIIIEESMNRRKNGILDHDHHNHLIIDQEFKVAFIQENKKQDEDSGVNVSATSSQIIDKSILRLTDDELRNRLLKRGESPGPIVSSTRDFYRKRLQRLTLFKKKDSVAKELFKPESLEEEAGGGDIATKIWSKNLSEQEDDHERGDQRVASLMKLKMDYEDDNEKETTLHNLPDLVPKTCNHHHDVYPKELLSFLEEDYNFSEARKLEKDFVSFFYSSGRKDYFNYILLDPRNRISRSDNNITSFDPDCFINFISRIFYIGKGEGKRPLMHLYEAALFNKKNNKFTGKTSKSSSEKISKILDIWSSSSSHGVVSLHLFHCISSDEALARECLMIEAIGIQNLTNIVVGSNKIKLLRFTSRQRKVLGSFFLFKAFFVDVNEGDNEIRLRDVRF